MEHAIFIDNQKHSLTSPDLNEKLHIITCITNYVRFKRRYELFWKFKNDIEKNKNIVLYVVEVALGSRPFMVTESANPHHLQLRTCDELWHKENALNLMVAKLQPGWKYLAWIDADIQFINTDFVNETIHALQHYSVVQMFESVANLGPDGQIITTFDGFGYKYTSGAKYSGDKYKVWHPGFAWACTREAFNGIGGLLDVAILGSGDHHMALAFIGMVKQSIHGGTTPEYQAHIMRFQDKCDKYIKKNIGYVKGTIIHGWHGKYANRKYNERWKILVDNKYNPDTDIKKDWQGLYQFNDTKINLRDDIRNYFRQRNEDGTDL